MRILASLAALPLAACSFSSSGQDAKPGVPGSGSGTARTYAVADFTGIELSGADDVDVRVGSGFSVRAEGPSDELDKLKIDRDGDTMRIGRVSRSGIQWGDGDRRKITVYVTLPRLAEATIAGSGNMSVDRIEGQDFAGHTAGSGTLTIAAIAVQSGSLEVAGSGDMKLAGTVRTLSVDIAGSGDVDASAVSAESAEVSIAGSGGVQAAVNGPAKVNLMGSGDVDLGKGAKCTVSKLGSGKVSCG